MLLQNYLQAKNLPLGGTVELNKLFKSAVLVTLCYDRTTASPNKLLALGIATFDRKSVNKEGLIDTFAGPHAENYLSHVWSMHLRQREHVHLPGSSDDPNAYHFGTSVFTTKDEMVNFLTDIWSQPMDEENPELGYRPIICVQHGNPYGHGAAWQELGFDPVKMDTTIAMLDSQVIAEQSKLTRNSYVEIDYLLGQFKIQPSTPTNCGNAAIYITIASMLCALRKHLYQSPQNPKSKPGEHGQSASKTAQAVVNEMMKRPTPVPPVGTEVYCLRCRSYEHFFTECPLYFD
ncbi:hypothetical protein P171DRAFT_372094 [Karstenula rhodostoma CBS 690.94]|uniref:Gfd2/YDR514C-like C-terminal domain-containing protein n=1 Tax=Karstenula rhodostoma CBS 690.94 TaxID=1392251 RepID=A0A9P4P7V6_9PLEO|nr:hypothetical protein P171DRAFT_372094 [Karstenula rhodostoma CBS 690.94]